VTAPCEGFSSSTTIVAWPASLQEFLKHKQCDSEIVDNGLDGLEALKSTHFDAAIVDLVMPNMDGIATLRAFRKLAPMLPIIFMTGCAFGNFKRLAPNFLGMASKLGATCCLHKPIQPRQLLAALDACLMISQIVVVSGATDGAVHM
jgi:two-component system response regulator (stage 0 sporulation protein F)